MLVTDRDQFRHYLTIFQAMVHKSNQINYIIRHFNMPLLERQEEKSYSIKGGLDQNACLDVPKSPQNENCSSFKCQKTILCLTNKHKTLLYYKQLKEISVNSNLSLVISGEILAMYTEIIAIVQFLI